MGAHVSIPLSGIQLWPFEEMCTINRIEGGSPLIWSMLHPPADDAQLITYAWTGHLDNFTLWVHGKTDSTTVRTPLISHARWNIWCRTNLPLPPGNTDNLHSYGSSQGYQESPVQLTQMPSPNLMMPRNPQTLEL